MFTVIKKSGKTINAYRLGDSSPVLDCLISDGKIIALPDGTFEVMSREAAKGKSGHGQLAVKGDYIKIDSEGFPYPNEAAYFKANHTRLDTNVYEQLPSPLSAWAIGEPDCPEIEFLQKEKGLVIRKEDFDHTFTAPLWGTVESAPGDAVIVFYNITYAEDGSIADIDFNFVVREEFEKSYIILSPVS